MQETDEGDELFTRFAGLCSDLNMDDETQNLAWETFTKISQNCTLEGDKLHWLICALYVSCRKSVLPTASGQSTIQGNGISLTALLRPAKLSLIDFFQKMKMWQDMDHLSPDLRSRIKMLESNFHVSCIMFQKYRPIFNGIFAAVSDEAIAKGSRTKRKRQQGCTNVDIFKFCWTLYIRVKGKFPDIGDDLINSYHLLLCCLDLMFANALISRNSKDLLNSNFKALPDNYINYNVPEEGVPCILETLCETHEGILLEASQIREHYWKPYVLDLIKGKVLKGDPTTLLNMFSSTNYESNWKSINQEYDQYVLINGDFDERIFLGVDANQEIGTPSKQQPCASEEVDERDRSHLKRNLQANFNRAKFVPQTPLTGRKYLAEKDPRTTPISRAAQSVGRLQDMLQGRKQEPSQLLTNLFSSCKVNPQERVVILVKKLGDMFLIAYTQPSSERKHSQATQEFANNRLRLSVILFYKVLETILSSEKKHAQEKGDLSSILQEEIFTKSLLACCIEIVIFSYNSQRIFPWILNTFNLSPFHFYKVIELVIRGETDLPRAVVKHLNAIEECILEKDAWTKCSPLHTILSSCNYQVPTNDHVSITASSTGPSTSTSSASLVSPFINSRVNRVSNGSSQVLGSPVVATLQQRFGSPPVGSAAKRNLFGNLINEGNNQPAVRAPVISTQSATLTTTQTNTVTVTRQDPVQSKAASTSSSLPLSTIKVVNSTTMVNPSSAAAENQAEKINSPTKSKKVGSLGLFFRKFYYLASVRLKDLCRKLDMDREMQTKVWTCFEHMIVNHVSLMFDRHLDQILMCAIYVICKATLQNTTFLEIMRKYKTQPQSESSVYRHVIIKSASEIAADNPTLALPTESPTQSPTTRTTRSQSARRDGKDTGKSPKKETNGSPAKPVPTPVVVEEKIHEALHGDLIHFYNKVFVHRVKDFAMRFASTKTNNLNAPPLSPLPATRRHAHSPRKVSNRLELFVSPIKAGTVDTLRTNMLYCFDRSPAKRLREINSMVGSNKPAFANQRVLTLDSNAEGPSEAKRSARANAVFSDRHLNQSKEK